jgi:hypothetical protein
MTGVETDTSELVNEMIASVKSFGKCGITGVYVGYVRKRTPFLPNPFLSPLFSLPPLPLSKLPRTNLSPFLPF